MRLLFSAATVGGGVCAGVATGAGLGRSGGVPSGGGLALLGVILLCSGRDGLVDEEGICSGGGH